MSFKPADWPRRLRSQEWFGGTGRDQIYHRGWMKNQGFPHDLFDGRPVIVQAQSREVVYSPGYVIPDGTVAYVEQNPVAPVVIDAPIQVGTPLPPQVQIVPVPSAPSYGYVYTETGPVLVQANTRTIVWVAG